MEPEFGRPAAQNLELIKTDAPEKIFREINKEILARDVFEEHGVDFHWIVRKLKSLYNNAYAYRVDKHGKIIQIEDQRLRLEILALCLKSLGAFDQKGKASDSKTGLADLLVEGA